MSTRPLDSPLRREAGELAPEKQPGAIAGMFDAIARRYDLLNHLLSGGLDWYWRWRAVRRLRLSGRETVLDLCTGTADLAIAASRAGAARVVGIDFAGEMLRVGRRKLERRALSSRVPLVRADAMRVPAATGSMDAAMIAFGIRNVADPDAALEEIARVVRPGGRLAILEFSLPRMPVIRGLYSWYFRQVLPRIGRLVSRHGEAYTYLPVSVGAFTSPDDFAASLSRAGFTEVRADPLTLGIVYLYSARRGPASPGPQPESRA
jgi:demethylmenaquinone methyltransferase / 2-methoxy-6-polyprenyl-1,4-benzoquinol methylase